MKTEKDFLYEIEVLGFSLFENVVPSEMIVALRNDIEIHTKICADWQKKNNLPSGMDGSGHHVLGREDSLDHFLYNFFLDEYISAYFENSAFILNSYGAVDNLPQSKNTYQHAHHFHRDVRTYSNGFRLMLNMLVMIDDFTIENGATKVVAGSHKVKERPSDEFLENNTIQVTGSAGCIILFDSNLWHSAAPNKTDSSRKALTPTFTRAFMKQQMDYPRMLGEEFPKNEKMRQLLGYNSRVPASHDEWYQPPEKRMYKPGQG